MKICGKCEIEKPNADFHRESASPDGLQRWCVSCQNEYKLENKARANRLQRRRRMMMDQDFHTLRQRGYDLKRRYGLTLEEYDLLMLSQDNACAICGSQEIELVVDHNHDTGEIRGLLCRRCNIGIGCFDEDKSRMLSAIDYLIVEEGDIVDVRHIE